MSAAMLAGLALPVSAQETPAPTAASANASASGAAAPAASGAPAAASGSASGRRGGAPRGARNPAPPPVLIPRDSEPFTPADFKGAKPDLVSLVVAGDSTATRGDPAHRGWAALLVDYFDQSKINLVNPSIGGRSFRSFYHEGRWDQLVAGLKPGDIVMIQFGHNDGGDINNPNGRPDLPGLGEETQTVTRADGTTEVVHTLGWYLRKYIEDVKAKGATPIVLGDTPYNRWANGSFVKKSGDFSNLTKQVADNEKVLFLDLTAIINDHYGPMTQEQVRPMFNMDGLHTTTSGAIVGAEMFVAGIKTADLKPLVAALNDKGKAIPAYKPSEEKPAAAPAPPEAKSAPSSTTK
ncbi:MAG TPA: GDSL-type esterase/lipase family protein [Opitutales bacterium]|nr:GDSL-type esterase/lipase family protein [Opitutales bacterium]